MQAFYLWLVLPSNIYFHLLKTDAPENNKIAKPAGGGVIHEWQQIL